MKRVAGVSLWLLVVSVCLFNSNAARAGFSGTDLILPAVGRIEGAGGAQFFTTIWVTNPSTTPVDIQIEFLRSGQANPDPPRFAQTLGPGETRVYENAAESMFGIKGVLGAVRFRASTAILAHLQPGGRDAARRFHRTVLLRGAPPRSAP